MGMVLEFPADATMRRLGATAGSVVRGDAAKVLILPVVRIERHDDGHEDAEDSARTESTASRLPRG